jgi:hypothetical protein
MPIRKKYRITYQRTEDLIVEVDAFDEAEARTEAFDFVMGKSPPDIRNQPRASVPQVVSRSPAGWSFQHIVELSAG